MTDPSLGSGVASGGLAAEGSGWRSAKGIESELWRYEGRLRAFFENSGVFMYIADGDDRIIEINRSGLNLLGFSDAVEVIGRRLSDFMMWPEERQGLLENLRVRGKVNGRETILRGPGDSRIWCTETAHAERDDAGEIIEIQGVVKDISYRIRAERELWKINLQLAEANRELEESSESIIRQEKLAAIGKLAAGIANGVSTPLTFLLSTADALSESLASIGSTWKEIRNGLGTSRLDASQRLQRNLDEAAIFAADTFEGLSRIKQVVRELAEFAHPSPHHKVASCCLADIVEASVRLAVTEIRRFAVVETRHESIPPISADSHEIEQVLLNLLMNSAQAIASTNPQTQGRIDIETTRSGDWARCLVSDNGPGIPQGSEESIFDPFVTTKSEGEGTGLGLSISWDIIVNRHKGRMGAEASPDGGARVWFELPLFQDGASR